MCTEPDQYGWIRAHCTGEWVELSVSGWCLCYCMPVCNVNVMVLV